MIRIHKLQNLQMLNYMLLLKTNTLNEQEWVKQNHPQVCWCFPAWHLPCVFTAHGFSLEVQNLERWWTLVAANPRHLGENGATHSNAIMFHFFPNLSKIESSLGVFTDNSWRVGVRPPLGHICNIFPMISIGWILVCAAQSSTFALQLCFASRLCQLCQISGLVSTCKPWIPLRTLQLRTNSHYGFDFVTFPASFAPLSVCFHLQRTRLSFWKERFGWQRIAWWFTMGSALELHANLAWDPKSNTCGGI